MAGIAAIRVDDEQDVSCGATNRSYTDLAIIAAFVLSLERRTREDAGGVIEAKPPLTKGTSALSLIPFENHIKVYALSVVRSTRHHSKFVADLLLKSAGLR